MVRQKASHKTSERPSEKAIIAAFSRLSYAVSAEYEPGKALNIAAKTAAELLDVDGAGILLFDSRNSRLALTVVHELAPNVISLLKAAIKTPISSGAPLAIPDLARANGQKMTSLRSEGIAAFASMPLRVGDRTLGALVVANSTPRAFPADDIELLSAIANQAALAVWKSHNYHISLLSGSSADLEKPDPSAGMRSLEDVVQPKQARLVELTNRKERELETLYCVSEAVVSTIDLSKLLKATLEQAMAAVGAGVGSIMLLDDETGRLSIHVSKGVPKEYVESASVALGDGISGWVALNGEGVLINDPSIDPRFKLREVRKDLSSAMSVPLRTYEKIVGVLNVSTVLPNKAFDRHDLELLSTLANQMASAIENARLYDHLQRRSAQLSTAIGVARTITSTLDVVEVQRLLADQLCGLGRVDMCVLLLFDEKTGRLRLGHGRGLKKHKKPHHYLDLAQPLARRAINDGRLTIATHATLNGDVARIEGIVSGAAMPLTARETVVGVACLYSREHRHLLRPELDLLEALSEPAGVAVENARVYQHQYKIARLLQKHLTPTTLDIPGLDVGHKYLPAHDVGGDYYDFIKIAEGKVGLLMADVAGSSVSAAVYTSMGKHVLRAYARENHSPADVLTKVNRIIYEDTEPELFISMLYGVFDATEGTFCYASGGHEPALLYHSADRDFERLHAPGILLGILPEADFEEKTVRLLPGDIVAVFTDGLTETSLDGKAFGAESVSEVIAVSALQPAQTIADNLYERLLQFADNRIVDDVGIVIVKAL